MPRDRWQGSSLWLGVGVTLGIHLVALILIAQWRVPVGSESSRLVSVLIAPLQEAARPEPSKPPAPPKPRPRVEPPVRGEPAGPFSFSLPSETPLLRLDAPDSNLPPAVAMLPAIEAPRPRIGIEASSLPARVVLRYTVRSSIVDGRAQYEFRREDNRYTISGFLEADGFFAQMFAGRFEQESEGSIGPAGLEPRRFSLKRGDAQAEIATFDRSQGKVVHQRIKSEHVQLLEPGAQDLQSFIFQFSPEFTRDPNLRSLRFAITNARKMDRYEFEVKGRETIPTVLGNLETLHLVRRTDDPTEAYEAWLSPGHQYLPVRLRYLLSGRFQVEQNLASLTVEP